MNRVEQIIEIANSNGIRTTISNLSVTKWLSFYEKRTIHNFIINNDGSITFHNSKTRNAGKLLFGFEQENKVIQKLEKKLNIEFNK